MSKPTRFDPAENCVAVTRDLAAMPVAAQPDPPVAVEGLTIGIATMTENAPHGGEMHPDGDEVLYLISGRVKVVFEDDAFDAVVMHPGDGLIVPKGIWHRVDILEPSQIFYATPGPRGEYRAAQGDGLQEHPGD